MRLLMSLLLMALSLPSFALECDCTVSIHSPLTGPIKLEPTVARRYELQSFDSYSVRNQLQCRKLCVDKFEEDLPSGRLAQMLKTHSQDLINGRVLGFNCTGFTTLKFPIRVKAQLGEMSIGNVADEIHIINHEEICFDSADSSN